MILTCTSCSTRYYADDGAIGGGRTVRCAACGNSWYAEPQLELREKADDAAIDQSLRSEPLTRERVERLRRAAEQPGPAPSAAAKFRAQQADRMRRERTRAAIAAWGATGAAVAASAAGIVVFRQDVAELWPRSASAFAFVGLPVNVYGLDIYDLTVERSFEGQTPVLLVSGEIRNVGRDDKQLPPIRLSLRDGQSHEVLSSIHAVGQPKLHGGESTPFQIRVENPPTEAVDLEATFASMEEGHRQAVADATPAHEQAPLELTQPVDESGQPVTAPATAAAGPIDGLAPRFSPEGHG